MKRAFAHIGFSFALSMLVLNLISAHIIIYVTIGLATLLVASLFIKKYRQAMAVPLCLGAAVFACVIFMFTYNNVVLPEQSLANKSANCEFYIIDLPEKNSSDEYVYTIKTTAVYLDNSPQNIKLRLKTDEPINCESHRLIKGRLKFYGIGNSAQSSYSYWGKNIFLSSKAAYYKITDTDINSPMKYITKARLGIRKRLSTIPGDEGALARALLIGDKSGISNTMYNNFKTAGVSHLMAVSGLHLGVISAFALFIMKRLKVKDKASFIITTVLIIYYCALCGFTKSVVRAGIMVCVLMIGKLLNRHGDTLNSLGIAAFIICINPFAVWDVGAMLSVLSVLAICTAYPIAEKSISTLKLFKSYYLNYALRYVLKSFALISCIILYQLPVLFIFFGNTSLVGIISSIILVPLGSLATILSLLTSLAVRIKIGLPFVLLTRFTNKAMIFLVEKLASLRLLVINFENYFGFVIAGILIILAICFIINKRYIKTAAPVSLAIIVISLFSMAVLNNSASYAYITKDGAVAIYSKNSTVVFGVNTKSDYYAIKSFVSSRSDKIDCILANSNAPYSEMLKESFDCDNLAYRAYSQSFSDDFCIEYENKKDHFDFTAAIGDITISENNTYNFTNDISITDKICSDKNGSVDLNGGDIIYRISKNNYKARRVSVWQE